MRSFLLSITPLAVAIGLVAAATAALISSSVDSGNSAVCSPVAGLNTGERRVDEET